MSDKCEWVQDGYDESDNYSTGCGNNFILNEGTPEDNDLKYCCYCGKELKQVLFDWTEE